VRSAIDRVPTRWFAVILTGLFLLVTAAFGSLNDVPAAAIPTVEPETVVEGQQFDIAIDRAVLIDEFPGFIEPEVEANRLLVIVAEVENASPRPLAVTAEIGLLGALEIRSDALVGARPREVLSFDDETKDPTFQPGVPLTTAIVWEVDPDRLGEGDDLEIAFVDRTFRAEGTLIYGGVWEDPVVTATLTMPIEDVGAGAEPDEPETDEEAGS
jgi:hypothetical protein